VVVDDAKDVALERVDRREEKAQPRGIGDDPSVRRNQTMPTVPRMRERCTM
jgi:hypothetical protein